ncbi:MAG: hypothetical protein ACHQAY_06105 [Hyphomicrobiales bacterium]
MKATVAQNRANVTKNDRYPLVIDTIRADAAALTAIGWTPIQDAAARDRLSSSGAS